jgi:hypothetical protein
MCSIDSSHCDSGFWQFSFPMLISTNNTFDKALLAIQNSFKRHNYSVYAAAKALVLKTAIVLINGWDFEPCWFLLDLRDIRNPFQVDQNRLLPGIALSGFILDDSFTYLDQKPKGVRAMNVSCKSAWTPKVGGLAFSLAPYTQAEARTYHLYREEPEEEVKNEGESYRNRRRPLFVTFRSIFVIKSIDNSEVYR